MTLEGPDGCGKSTQAALLKKRLIELGRKVVHTREPGGTSLAENLRKILLHPEQKIFPLAELLLYESIRAQHTEEVILPALKRGEIVLCERYADATLAYQGYGRELPLETILTLNRIATKGLTPHLTIVLDIPVSKGLKRARKLQEDGKKGDRLEREGLSFHSRVREGYLAIARKEPKRVRMISSLGSVKEVQEKIWVEIRNMSFFKWTAQKRAVLQLGADLESERVGDCYLFIGSSTSPKREIAFEFAKSLSCEKRKDGSGCDKCSACRKIDRRTHPDIILLDFERQGEILGLKEEERAKQKEYRIDSIRILLKIAYLTPLEGKKKIFMIDGAEFLSLEAASALLKALEEAPPYLHWILLTDNLERVISTIQSRSRKVYFSPEEKEEDLAVKDVLGKAVEEILHGNCAEPLQLSEKIFSKEKGNNRKLASDFLGILSEKMAEELRDKPTSQFAERTLNVLRAQEDLRRNLSPQIVLDELLLNL